MKKRILTAAAVISLTVGANAQGLKSAYFMEGYNFRHEFNPAFRPQRSYFAIPGIGNLSLGVNSNLGVDMFLYPYGDGLTTFMNESVSADQFLGKLRDNNKIFARENVNMLSIGIGGKNSFWTFDINTKVDVRANLPYSLFSFMKNVGKSQVYDISNLAASATGRMEFALGYSHRIADLVDIGVRAKFLVGIIDADIRVDKMKVTMSGDQWAIQSKGSMQVSVPGLDIKTRGESGKEFDSPEDADVIDFDSIDTKDVFSPSEMTSNLSMGGAIDIGAAVQVIPGLRASFAFNDIGFMSWNGTIVADTGEKAWMFDGFDDISFDEGSDNSIGKQFKDLGDDLSDMINFHRKSTDATKLRMLAMTMNIGAEYEMPFYHGLTAGILSSTVFNGPYTYAEGRLYANLKPTRWFSLGANYGIGSTGSSFGAVMGFHTGGFSFFLGTDSIFTNISKGGVIPYYPYKQAKVDLTFSMSFNIGRRSDTYASRSIVEL